MKKGKMKRGIKALVGLATVFGMCASIISSSATNVVAEEATVTWTTDAATNTSDLSNEDIGKVWTDKTVQNDTTSNDAIITLSALSSTTNSTTTATTSVPLDIVLVLDQSGSMADNDKVSSLKTAVTSFVNTISENAKNNNVDHRVAIVGFASDEDAGTSGSGNYTISEGSSTSGWINTGLYVNGYLKNYGETTEETYTEVYSLDTSKTYYVMSHGGGPGDNGYKSVTYDSYYDGWYDQRYSEYYAKTSFDDSEWGHTQFYERTETKQGGLTAKDYQDALVSVNTTDASTSKVSVTSSITTAISHIAANGGTYTEYGMKMANQVFANNTIEEGSNRKRIVVVFSDGEPSSNETFVDALSEANTTKSTYNASVYTIGWFGDNSEDAELFMNYLSSNYTNAAVKISGDYYHGYTYDYSGEKTEGGDYSKNASDSSNLNSIFQSISSEITSGDSEALKKETNLVFTDTLGEYVEVDGGIKVKIDDKTSYSFDKNDKGVYACEKAPAELIVAVADGVVTVTIPQSLIPLNQYNKKNNDWETPVTHNPLTVTYKVKLVDDLAKQIANDATGYVDNHKDSNGTVYFLTNSVNESEAKTTATFTPADGNPYYSASKINETTNKSNASITSTANYVNTTSKNEDGTYTTKLGNNGKVSLAIGKVEFTKVDSLNNTALSGAKFTLYTDVDCTTGNEVKNDVISGENGAVKFENILQGKYYLKETEAPDGYETSGKVYTVEVSSTGSVTIKDGETVVTNITNEPKKIKVKITKLVTGNMGDTAKEFSFTVTSDKQLGKYESVSSTDTLEEHYKLDSESVSAEFTLKHGYYTYVYVPYGSTITVSETSVEGYETDIRIKDAEEELDNGRYQVTETDDSQIIEIVVTNEKNGTIDTGIFDDTTPYFVIIGLVTVGSIAMIIGNRRRKTE